MAWIYIQVSLAWLNVVLVCVLCTEHHLPGCIKSRPEKNFWGSRKVLRWTFQPDSSVLCTWFLCFDCYDSLVEPVHGKLHLIFFNLFHSDKDFNWLTAIKYLSEYSVARPNCCFCFSDRSWTGWKGEFEPSS